LAEWRLKQRARVTPVLPLSFVYREEKGKGRGHLPVQRRTKEEMKFLMAFEAFLIGVVTGMTIKVFPEFLEALKDMKETYRGNNR
jgi:hypothetical protein